MPGVLGIKRSGAERELTSLRRSVTALAMGTVVVLKLGWHEPVFDFFLMHLALVVLLACYGGMLLYATFVVFRGNEEQSKAFRQVTAFERVVTLVGLLFAWWWPAVALAGVLLLLAHTTRWYLTLVQRRLPPGLVFVGSFVVLIAVGTAILLLPAATPRHHPEYAGISVTDAFFTITSAISQTGLVVRPTGEGFTRFGQVVILVWIQVGALGVIVFGALLASIMGKSFGLRATQTIAEPTEQGWSGQLSLQRLVAFIIIITHLTELIGAGVLFFGWPERWPGMPVDMDPALGGDMIDRAYHAVFFSVSAFCNAGFSTTGNSMEGLRTHWTPHLVLVPLIVFGSIGFPVLENAVRVVWAKIRKRRIDDDRNLIRLTLNTKLIIATAIVVYMLGVVVIAIGESGQAGVGFPQSLLDAHFMSINRTSGFDTIPPAEMGILNQLVLILLMFIGGAPASVAGGCKLIVVAVLALTVWSTLVGKDETVAFGRTIPDAAVRKCAVIIVMCLGVCLAATGVLAVSETPAGGAPPPLRVLLFETVSAFGTTGLSLGITEDLSTVGKITISVTMFLGRVGVLAVVASLVAVTARVRTRVEYPNEPVVVY